MAQRAERVDIESQVGPSEVFVAGFYFTRDEWDALSDDDRSQVLWPEKSPPLTSKVGGERDA